MTTRPEAQQAEETTPILGQRQRRHDKNKTEEPQWWTPSSRAAGGVVLAVVVAILLLLCRLASKVVVEQHDDDGNPCVPEKKNETPKERFEALKQASTVTDVKDGAVASDHPVCSQMGVHMLQDLGGNAIDAAITVALCLGVANPASSGLGGGAFLMIHAPHITPIKDSTELPPFHDQRHPKNHHCNQSTTTIVPQVIDCREVAPSAAYQDMFLDHETVHTAHGQSVFSASEVGGLAVPVPGELKCLELAHAQFGRLPWSTVVQPAARLARRGVKVNANLAHEIQRSIAKYQLVQGQPPPNNNTNTTTTASHDFLRSLLTRDNDWRHPLQVGDVLKNQALAKTLDAIQTHGAKVLYDGNGAAQLAADLQAAGSWITANDLQQYQATLRDPCIARGVAGTTLVGTPPPSSGGAAILGAARFLAGFDAPYALAADTLSVHRLVEAQRHVFAIRMSLADPDFDNTRTTTHDAVQDLVQGDYMEMLRRHYYRDNATQPLSHYGGPKWAQLRNDDAGAQENVHDAKEGDRMRRRLRLRKLHKSFGYLNDHGTSHFVVVDGDRNAVSMTTSINNYFGSHVCSPSTGLIFSSTMDDFGNPGRPNYFGLPPSPANFIRPGKRPLSSMSPMMVFRERTNADSSDDNDDNDEGLGELMLAMGSSGGPRIISALLAVLTHYLWRGLSLPDALAQPRVHDQLLYHGAAVLTYENSTIRLPQRNHHHDYYDFYNNAVSQRTLDALRRRQHRLLSVQDAGTVQAIAVDLETQTLTAACDVRKGGRPAGY